jgi:hypothetical protein
LAICNAFFDKMSRPISFEFRETPVQEALTFIQTLCKCSMILDPRASTAGAYKSTVTIKCTNKPMATVLSEVLAKTGLDWTIEGRSIYLTTPARVNEIHEKYPETGRALMEFRAKLRAEEKKAREQE